MSAVYVLLIFTIIFFSLNPSGRGEKDYVCFSFMEYESSINFLKNRTYEKPISKIIISNSTRSSPENIIEIGFECHRIIFSFGNFTVCSIFASPTDLCEGSKNCYHKIQISKSNQTYQSLVLFQSFASLIPLIGEANDCLNLSNQINFLNSISNRIEFLFQT